MHIISSLGAFALALTLFVYLPGRLVLRVARIIVDPLDALALSLNLGLVVSAGIYWFLRYFSFRQYFIFGALAAAGIYVYYWRKEWSWPGLRIKGPQWLLIGTILLGLLLLAVLPIYYSNMTRTREGELNVCPLFDAPLHAAIANELTHSVPPQNPIFSGRPLSYHVGADLPAAMFANMAGLDVADLTLRFIPSLFFIVTLLSVFCFSRLWLASEYGAVLVTFLVVFGEDLSFIPGLLQSSASDWSTQYFSVPSTFSLFCINPMLPALGFLFGGFYCLLKSISTRQLVWQLVAGLLFAALAECKIFTALHIGVSLALVAAFYFVVFRNPQMLQTTVIAAICMMPVFIGTFLSNRGGSQIVALFFQSHTIRDMVQQLGLTTQLASLSPALLLTTIAAPIFLIGSLGLRVIGLPAALKEVLRPRKESPMRLFLALFVFIGLMLGLVISIVPKGIPEGYDNGVWFYVQSKYVAWTFAVETILIMLRTWMPSRLQRVVVTAVVVAVSVPSTIQHFVHFNSAYKSVLLSPNAVRVLLYLKTASHPGEVVFSSEELVGPILAMTKCHIPAGRYAEYMVPIEEYHRRIADFSRFWTDWQDGRIRDDILRAYGVNYFVVTKQQDARSETTTGLVTTFENAEWIVYRVADVGANNIDGG